MSSNDYDEFIIQKYRIAIAIAVLKTKPHNISIQEHVNDLKILNDFDDDVTICESDFDINESDGIIGRIDENDDNNSISILNNVDVNNFDAISEHADDMLVDVMQELNDIDNDTVSKQTVNTKQSESTYFEASQKSQHDLIKNIAIEIDNKIISDQININNEEDTAQDHSNKKPSANPNDIDSQETELYTVHDFGDYNTHISQSQDYFVIAKNCILNNAKTNALAQKTNTETELLSKDITISENQTNIKSKDITIKENKTNVTVHKDTNNNDRKSKLNNTQKVKSKRAKIDSVALESNSHNDISIEFLSQSTCSNERNNNTSDTFNFDLKTNSTQSNSNKELIPGIVLDNQDTFDSAIKINRATNIVNSLSLDEFEYNTQSQNFRLNNITHSDKIADNKDAEDANLVLTDDKFQQIEDVVDISNENSDEVNDLTESQVELVSFKVLEELSKVKSYLNRRERSIKSDSGYRSFQPRSSGDSASQCSSLWINESAHCLMNFLKTCPLIMSTIDITEEISKVLGKLIDRLHEDEIYPNFLEEILDICNSLLKTIYEGRNYGENILDKDDLINRLLKFNRSSHIIKYSIERIMIILEKTLEKLNETFEIEHTDESENICYIFVILEDLLRRNISLKNASRNSSQSQEDRILKRSSLTEIWRKKWNLTKSDICEGTMDRKCPMTKCSDVLNKIIVQAMDGYSLVSFAALQCFNLLQN